MRLREGVAMVARMTPEALDFAATPAPRDLMDRPHRLGGVPSLVRMLARIRRDDLDGWHVLMTDLWMAERKLELARDEAYEAHADQMLIAALTVRGCLAELVVA